MLLRLTRPSGFQGVGRGVPRVGDVPIEGPLLIEGMDLIDVTSIGSDILELKLERDDHIFGRLP